MTKASRDTQGGRKVKGGKKERKKERKREGEKGRGEKRKRQVFPATNKRPGAHHRKRGMILIQENPRKQGKKGGGKGEEGGVKFSTFQ